MRTSIILSFLLISGSISAQVMKLDPTINRVGSNNFLPVISGDGQFLLYRSDLSFEGNLLFYTTMTSSGRWTKQEVFNKVIDAPGVNTIGGFYLNFDATVLFFTSRRYGSMGGFDIWYSEKKGSTWGPPQNAGKPVNSTGHEADPSLSADGKTLFFTRCQSVTEKNASGCSIWKADRKSNGYFEEPVKLPSPVNTGNEMSPIILADDISLIFASSRPGGKGGLDLYLTRFENDTWSDPVALDFINTEKDDRYATVPVKGDVIFYTGRDQKGELSIYKAKIPEEFQPYKVLWLDARVVSQGSRPVQALVQYSSLDEPLKFKATDENGYFNLILKEGKEYDVAVVDRDGKYTFSSTRFDLKDADQSKRDRQQFIINPLRDQTVQPLDNISFKNYSSELTTGSEKDLQRLIYLMQKNQQYKVEIDVYQMNYREDSIMSDPDLTEHVIDTLTDTSIVEKIDTLYHEYTAEALNNNPAIDSLMADSLIITNTRRTDEILDSLNNLIANSAETPFEIVTQIDTLVHVTIKHTYHNDRSQKQAEEIVNFLKGKGAPSDRLLAKGMIRRNESEEPDKEIKVEARFLQ